MKVAEDTVPVGRVATARNSAAVPTAVAAAANAVTMAKPRWEATKASFRAAKRVAHWAKALRSALATRSLPTPSTNCMASPKEAWLASVCAVRWADCERVKRKIPAAPATSTTDPNSASRDWR